MPDIGVLKDPLCAVNGTQELIAFFIHDIDSINWFLKRVSCAALGVLWAGPGNIFKLDEVLRQYEGVVQNKPHTLLLIIFLRSEHALHSMKLFGVDRGVSPDLRRAVAWVEIWEVRIRNTLREENFANKELTRGDLDQTLAEREF